MAGRNCHIGGKGCSEISQSSFFSVKVFMAHSEEQRATSQPFASRARAVPMERAGRVSGARGSPSVGFSQRAMDQSAGSMRVSAAYSPWRRCWRTSN